MMTSSQISPIPKEKSEAVSSKITLKQIIEKAHDKNKKLHDILGGGTVADVLLWSDTISSLTLIFVATEIWFICSSIKLYIIAEVLFGVNFFLLCQCLVTLLLILYYLPKIDKYLHHQTEETVGVLTKQLIAFKFGGDDGWYPFGALNKLINAVSPAFLKEDDYFVKLLTMLKERKFEVDDDGGWDSFMKTWEDKDYIVRRVLESLKNYFVELLEKSDARFKDLLNDLCKTALLLDKVKEAILSSGQDQPDSLKEVVIFIINTCTKRVKEVVFGREFRTGIGKETVQMFIMVSTHLEEDTDDSTSNRKGNKNFIDNHKDNEDSTFDNQNNEYSTYDHADDEDSIFDSENDEKSTSYGKDDKDSTHDHKNKENFICKGKEKLPPMKWAVAYLEWLAISILLFRPATVVYMGYICIATVPALFNYLMGGSQVDKSVKSVN